jgi:hypothetical protein
MVPYVQSKLVKADPNLRDPEGFENNNSKMSQLYLMPQVVYHFSVATHNKCLLTHASRITAKCHGCILYGIRVDDARRQPPLSLCHRERHSSPQSSGYLYNSSAPLLQPLFMASRAAYKAGNFSKTSMVSKAQALTNASASSSSLCKRFRNTVALQMLQK